MDFYSVPEGKGQKVYIDSSWIKGEDEDSCFFIMSQYENSPVRIVRRQLCEYLIDLGYEIITDKKRVSEDTFFFSPLIDEKNIDDYITKKNKLIEESLLKENITSPTTISIPEDNFPVINKFPIVLKNINLDGGVEKFIIRNTMQLEKVKKIYEEGQQYDYNCIKQELINEYGPGVEVNEDGTTNVGLIYPIVDYKKLFHKDFKIQQYIETPTNYNTSLRVLVTSSGGILVSSLKYSNPSTKSTRKPFYPIESLLCDETTPFYIDTESIVSNQAIGGQGILIGKQEYTEEEKEILKMHEISFDIPLQIKNAAISLAKNCRKEIGAITGVDFIYDKNQKRWYYLEQQEYPMLISYAEKYGKEYSLDFKDFNKYHRIVDIEARLKSLNGYMKNKEQKETDVKDNQKINKKK